MRYLGIAIIAVLFPLWVTAAIEVHQFEDPALERRFEQLTQELRCPKCQNQNIAGSNAPIAEDMRDEVYRRLQAGQSDEEIMGAMVERFGKFVQYRPPLTAATAFLWFGPVLLALMGLLLVLWIVRRRKRPEATPLSAADRARVDALLQGGTDPDQQQPNAQSRH